MRRSASKAQTQRGQARQLAGLVALFVALVFLPSLGSEFVNWDDPTYVLQSPYVRPSNVPWRDLLLTPALGYPLPLVSLLYRLCYTIFGPWAPSFHTLNWLAHIACAYWLARLLSLWLPRREAAIAAVLWACHPIVVETVSWVSGLKDTLANLGILLAFYGFVRLLHTKREPHTAAQVSGTHTTGQSTAERGTHTRTTEQGADKHIAAQGADNRATEEKAHTRTTEQGADKHIAAQGADTHAPIVAFLLGQVVALLAKPTSVVLAPLLVLYALMTRQGRILKRPLVSLSLSATFALALGACWLGIHNRHLVTTTTTEGGSHHLAMLTRAFLLQWQHVLWPLSLDPKSLDAPYTMTPLLWLAFVPLAGLLVLSWWAWRRKQAHVSFFALWILVTYAPVSNLIPLHRFTADTYFVAPLIGVMALVGFGLQAWLSHPKRQRKLAPLLVVGLLVHALTLLTLGQQKRWQDAESLWHPMLQTHPTHPFVIQKAADALRFRGKKAQALAMYRRHHRLFRKHRDIPTNYPILLAEAQHTQRAQRLFFEALRINKTLSPELLRNTLLLHINKPSLLKPYAHRPLRKAIKALAPILLTSETNPTLLAEYGRIAAYVKAFHHAEELFGQAWKRQPRPVFRRAAYAACRNHNTPSQCQRWLPH